MNLEVKKKWVEALRSGEYKQGKGRLKSVSVTFNVSFHCCLGVLCEVYKQEGGVLPPYWNTFSFLPADTIAWAGVGNCDPYCLSYKNDNEGMTFEEIADYIETWL